MIDTLEGEILGAVTPITEISAICSVEIENHTQKTEAEEVNRKEAKIKEILEKITIGDRNMPADTKTSITNLVTEFQDIFAGSQDEVLKTCPYLEMSLNIIHDIPCVAKPARIPIKYKELVQQELDKLLKKGIIVKSNSLYNNRCHFIRKPGSTEENVKLRLVIDAKPLNKLINPLPVMIPNLEELFSSWNGMTLFTICDLQSSFYQLRLDPKSSPATAFQVDSKKYEFTRGVQGLSTTPHFLNLVTNKVVEDIPATFAYVDDISSFMGSENYDQLVENLTKLFERRLFNLSLNPAKVIIGCKEVSILGHLVSDKGITVCPKRVKDLLKCKKPTTVKQCRSFLGMVNFLRTNIPNLAEITLGLNKDLRQGTKTNKFKLTEEGNESFEKCLEAVKNTVTLGFPPRNKKLYIRTDASNESHGSILFYKNDNDEIVPLGFHSKIFKQHQKNMQISSKEYYSIYYAVTKRWRQFVIGS